MAKYCNVTSGNDGNDGSTWALAKLTPAGLASVLAASEYGFIQGTIHTQASTLTLSFAGRPQTPNIVIGVAIGTTNEPPVLSDLAVTKPIIETTGNSDINFGANSAVTMFNTELIAGDNINTGNNSILTFLTCVLKLADDFWCNDESIIKVIDSEFRPANSFVNVTVNDEASFEMIGGTIILDGATPAKLVGTTEGLVSFNGVDMTDTSSMALASSGMKSHLKIYNCGISATVVLYETTANVLSSVEIVAGDSLTTRSDAASIRDYMYEDAFGTIDADFVQIRTGGASDEASGEFSYAMTPNANATLESSNATLKSPEIAVWVIAGSQTLTIYIANDGGVDYNEDEVWIEMLTPNANDQANHELNFFPGDARLFPSTTPITDDTTSVWGGTAANRQKLAIAVNPGFEGEARVRLHLAKRQATPDTLFLSPKIIVS